MATKQSAGAGLAADLIDAAVFSNSYKTLARSINSTGLVTKALRHRSLTQSSRPRLAEEFLVNTRLLRHDPETELSIANYFTPPSVALLSLAGSAGTAAPDERPLPEPAPVRMELGQIIAQRRSRRVFTGDPMSLDELAALLRGAAGVTGSVNVACGDDASAAINLRATPSGGGLYPVELYAAALRIDGLGRGIYRFIPQRNTLRPTGGASAVDQLLEAFAISGDSVTLPLANVIFLLVGQPWKSMRKYGDRGMRLLLLEAGAIAEHLNLIAVGLGCGSVDCASVYDDAAHAALEVDGLFQALLHTVIVGNPG